MRASSELSSVSEALSIGVSHHLWVMNEMGSEERMETFKENFVAHSVDKFGNVEAALAAMRDRVPREPIVARLDLQVLLNAVGREAEAFGISDELMQLAPEDPRVQFNRGWHLLARGELQNGMKLLEAGRSLQVYGNLPLPTYRKIWTPQDLNHRVHLVLEGGLGDEIIHFRFGRDLATRYGAKVTVVCQPALAGIFATQSWVAAIIQREAALGVYHDSWLPGMSAAFHLGYEYSDLSGDKYLDAPEPFIKKWASVLRSDSKLRVGIRWAGNPQFEHQQLRLFPADILLGLAQTPGVQLYSFQRDHHLLELPPNIINLGPHLQTWEDTAAALRHMDLVVSSCTSVAHCAAALGKSTWVIIPALPYYVWAQPGVTSKWYKSVRLFRQTAFNRWDDIEDKLKFELANWARGLRMS